MKKILLTLLLIMGMALPSFSAAWQVQEARSFYAKGQYEQALNVINEAIKSSSYNDTVAYNLRLDIYNKLNINNKYDKNILEDMYTLIKLTNNKSLYRKTGNINLKMGNYKQAFSDFCKQTDDKGNFTNFAQSIINANTDFIKIANNVNAPLSVRIQALDMIIFLYHKYNADLTAIGAGMKMFQLVALAPENAPFFVENKKTKKEALDSMKQAALKYVNDPIEYDFMEGLFEYSIGNKETGTKIMNGAINELTSRNKITEANECKSIFNQVKNILANGIPQNTLTIEDIKNNS